MILEVGTYKNSPIITIKTDETDRYPFSFGKTKAAKLLDVIEAYGIEEVIERLKEVANE